MLKVSKFGGSSLSDAAGFSRVREIIRADTARRAIVVSAPGKRHHADHKITDLLYLCHAHLKYGVSCWELWRRICDRYVDIRNGAAPQFPVEQELERIYASLSARTSLDWLVSRGEYLSARLMAAALDFSCGDSADWLRFDFQGRVLEAESFAALASAADGRKIVTPGFYGVTPGGQVHTFSRGGSDVTGALAAAALRADLYENWTDVPGVLAADPRIVRKPEIVESLSFDELRLLSGVGTQILHESAVEPVQRAQIPLNIRSTFQPDCPGTYVSTQKSHGAPVIGFAGKRQLAMLRVQRPSREQSRLLPFLAQQEPEAFVLHQELQSVTALFPMQAGSERLHGLLEEVQRRFGPEKASLRENLSVLAVLYRVSAVLAPLLAAVERQGVPVHQLLSGERCALLLVNDSQYETALQAIYAARQSGQTGTASGGIGQT